MGVTEEAGKVASSVVEVMRGAPVILALLLVNAAFLGFTTYLLGQVAANAREQRSDQSALISQLVRDIRECRTGDSPKSLMFRDIRRRP